LKRLVVFEILCQKFFYLNSNLPVSIWWKYIFSAGPEMLSASPEIRGQYSALKIAGFECVLICINNIRLSVGYTDESRQG
jgi:hypothetical protein